MILFTCRIINRQLQKISTLLSYFTVLENPKTLDQSVILGQNCESCDISLTVAFKEQNERAINIIKNLKDVNVTLDAMISELRMKKEALRIETCKLSNK